MKKNIQNGLLIILLGLMACDLPIGGNSRKKQLAVQVAGSACQDVRNLMVDYGGSLVPLVGKSIMEGLFKDKEGKGVLCDCLTNPVSEALDKRFTEEGLDEMTKNSTERRTQIIEIILENRQKIMGCYEESGSSQGIKLLEKVLDKFNTNLDEIKEDLQKSI